MFHRLRNAARRCPPDCFWRTAESIVARWTIRCENSSWEHAVTRVAARPGALSCARPWDQVLRFGIEFTPFLGTCNPGPCSRTCVPHLAQTQGLHLVAIIRAAVGSVGCPGAAHRQGHPTATCRRPGSRIAYAKQTCCSCLAIFTIGGWCVGCTHREQANQHHSASSRSQPLVRILGTIRSDQRSFADRVSIP